MTLAIFYLHSGKTTQSYMEDRYYHNRHYEFAALGFIARSCSSLHLLFW
jgi:hypothetical protein